MAQEWTDWPIVFEAVANRLRQEHGLGEPLLRATLEDKAGGAIVIVLDSEQEFEVVYSSKTLAVVTGWHPEEIIGTRGIDFFRLPDETHDLLNREAWLELHELRNRVLQYSGGCCPMPVTELLVSASASGVPFWNVLDVVPVVLPSGNRCRYVAHLLLRIEAPVPQIIFCEGAGEAALAASFVNTVREDLSAARAELAAAPEEDFVGMLAQAVERVRKDIVHIHEDAQEGDHYVPKLGWGSVQAFDKLHALCKIATKVQEELRAAWQVPGESCNRYSEGNGPQDVACCVTDPSGVDCPIVFVSAGFEDLTGYRRSWSLGRNCRFLQPNTRSTNVAVNRNELQRIRGFFKSPKAGHMLSLLLNERADGRHFWNLLFMKHIYPSVTETGLAAAGPERGSYVFAVLTSATVQKDALDMLVLQELGGPGSGEPALQRLRDALRKREEEFVPSKHSLMELAMEVSMEWVRHVGRQIGSFWEGNLYVPRVGVSAALDFSGRWPLLVDTCTETVKYLLSARDEAVPNLRANKELSVVCVVSDPLALDCPLVFLSRGFEEATGYDAAFALGRNCRFLQPSTRGMNEALNGEELCRIKEFCSLRREEALKSKPLTCLMLNQRRTGERFWNLLHLAHVALNGRPYLFGAQHLLTEVAMPGLLKDAVSSEAVIQNDEARMSAFNQDLGSFLSGLRKQLWAAGSEGLAGAADTRLPATPPELAARAEDALKCYVASCPEALEMECCAASTASGDILGAPAEVQPSSPSICASQATALGLPRQRRSGNSPCLSLEESAMSNSPMLLAAVRRSSRRAHSGQSALTLPDLSRTLQRRHTENITGVQIGRDQPEKICRGSPRRKAASPAASLSLPQTLPDRADAALAAALPLPAPVAPVSPKAPPQGRRFVRSHLASGLTNGGTGARSCNSGADSTGAGSAICEGSSSSTGEVPAPPAPIAGSEAMPPPEPADEHLPMAARVKHIQLSPDVQQLPPSEVAIPRAAVQLLERGWTPQDIGDLFGLDVSVIALLLAQH